MEQTEAAKISETSTIHELSAHVRSYIEAHYQRVFAENEERLQQVFAQVGEPAYGAFGRVLFQPLKEELAHYGVHCENNLPGVLQTSIERWGPPEDRERCLWTILRNADGHPLGTLVTRLFHDHTRFRLPRPPRVFALDVYEQEDILEALLHASVRITNGQEQRGAFLQTACTDFVGENWEYSVDIGLADGLERGRVELAEGLLDHALALWGGYGWEMVCVVSHHDQLLAFFRRLKKSEIEEG
jgi:hypothetical protein